MSAEHILVANIGKTDSLLSILKYRHVDNRNAENAQPKVNIGSIADADHLQVPTLVGHFNIGQALVSVKVTVCC